MNNPSSSGYGGRTTSESHQGVIQYLSAFAADTNLSHKEKLANHPDLPDPIQSAAEEYRPLKSLARSTQKKQKGILLTALDYFTASSLAGGWKVSYTANIGSYRCYCSKKTQVHSQGKEKKKNQCNKHNMNSLLLRFASSCKH